MREKLRRQTVRRMRKETGERGRWRRLGEKKNKERKQLCNKITVTAPM